MFSVNATLDPLDPNRCAMPLWSHFILNPNGDDLHVGFQVESIVYIKPNGGTRPFGFNPRRDSKRMPAALQSRSRRRRPLESRRCRRRDYIMTMARFTIYVRLLSVKVVNSCRQSCAMRCNPSAGAGTPAPARRDYIMTMARFTIYVMLLGVKVVSSSRQSRAMRCSPSAGTGVPARDYIVTMARLTIYVMPLGVKVVNSCRQSCAMRCNPGAGAGAGVPWSPPAGAGFTSWLWPDSQSVILLNV